MNQAIRNLIKYTVEKLKKIQKKKMRYINKIGQIIRDFDFSLHLAKAYMKNDIFFFFSYTYIFSII